MAGNHIWVKGLVTPAGMTEFEGTPYENSFEVFNSSSTARGLYLRDHPSGTGGEADPEKGLSGESWDHGSAVSVHVSRGIIFR